MKQLIIVFIILVLLCYNSCGKKEADRSYFIEPIATVCNYPFNDTTKWAITCRIWGFLKYYHPNVASGKLDWDKVLLDRIDKIHEAWTPEQVNIELMQMVRDAGKYKGAVDKSWNDSLNMNVNLCWLDHSFINDTIRQELRKIASLTNITPSQYLTLIGEMGIPDPKEKDYDKDVILQYKYRLLALFRYWNVIYYFYPYKYLMDQSWDETLSEFIPHFITAYDTPSYHKVVYTLATRLNDGHAFTDETPLFDKYKFKHITFIDSSTVIRIPPEGSLLERGDIILSLNGKNIRSIRDSIAIFIPSSNKHYTDNAVNGCIYNSIMDGCILTVMRNQQILTFSESRTTLPKEAETAHYLQKISSDIGYVNMAILKNADVPDLMDSINNYRGIIFDLRNYPDHLEKLYCNLCPTQKFHYALATSVDLSHFGAFYKHESIINWPNEYYLKRKQYNGKIVVLINAVTMSAAETQAMLLRIMRGATLVGTATAGANGGIVYLSLPGKIVTAYSGHGFYYPNGDQIQRTGIIPDIEVYPTMDDIMAGRDEVLEVAITYLNSN